MERLKSVLVSLLILVSLGLTGCKQLQPVVQQTTEATKTITVTETIRDTTFVLGPDSASIKAFLECDSLNQVVLRDLQIEKGRKVTPTVKFLQGGILEVKMPVDSEAVYLSWKEKYVQVADSVRVSKVSVIKDKPPWYERFANYIPWAIVAVFLLYLLKK